jgi:nicotinamidase-related amidase
VGGGRDREEPPDEFFRGFFRSRGFGGSIGLGRSPLILVIDMMRAFTDPSCQLGTCMDREVKVMAALLASARRVGVPTAFTVVSYDDPVREAGLWFKKMPALANLRRGTDLVAVDPRLGPLQSERLFHKRFASAFFGTNLHAFLQKRTIDTLILVGCTTSGCVRATAVDGLQHGYRCAVVADAVADRLLEAHVQSLADLQGKYADVVDSSAVEAYFGEVHSPAGAGPLRVSKGSDAHAGPAGKT